MVRRAKDAVDFFFAEDGWYDADELSNWSGVQGRIKTVRLLAEGRIFSVRFPVGLADDEVRFYHRTTPQLARAMRFHGWSACTFDATTLPCGLMRTLARKIPETMRRRRGELVEHDLSEIQMRSFAQMIRAAISVAENLEGMTLFADKPRPQEGFMYPCSWRIRSYPTVFPRAFLFNISFTGTVKNRTAPHLLHGTTDTPVMIYSHPEKECAVFIDRTEATMRIMHAATVSFNRETRSVEEFPPREKLVQDTATIIRDCASAPVVLPFAPLGKPEPFRLITPAAAPRVAHANEEMVM